MDQYYGSSQRPLGSLDFINLPYDLFLAIAGFLDIQSYVSLSSVCSKFRDFCNAPTLWTSLAIQMLDIRALPVPPLRKLSSLTPTELRRAVIRAARLDANISSPRPKLKATLVYDINGGQDLQLLTILPGGRHLVTCKDGDCLACWDLLTGKLLASWSCGKGDHVIQCRPVDGGRACMIIVFVPSATHVSRGWFELLRLQIDLDVKGGTSATFSQHMKFNEPDHFIADMSLSEDLINILTINNRNELFLVLLSWRQTSVCVGRTSIDLPAGLHPIYTSFFTLLAPTSVNIVWGNTERLSVFTYPNDVVLPHLSMVPEEPIVLPTVPSSSVNYDNNTDEFLNWTPHSSLAHRHWDTSLRGEESLHLSRHLSDFRTYQQLNLLVLSHNALAVPCDEQRSSRTFFASFEAVIGSPGTDPRHALVVADSKYAVWLEKRNETRKSKILLRICAAPTEEMRALKQTPEWYTNQLVRTLEVPESLNMQMVCDLALDEAQGNIVLSLRDGSLWVLHY